jgi:hypothetical protein
MLCLPVVLFVSGYTPVFPSLSIHVAFDFLNTPPIKRQNNVAFPLIHFCVFFSVYHQFLKNSLLRNNTTTLFKIYISFLLFDGIQIELAQKYYDRN